MAQLDDWPDDESEPASSLQQPVHYGVSNTGRAVSDNGLDESDSLAGGSRTTASLSAQRDNDLLASSSAAEHLHESVGQQNVQQPLPESRQQPASQSIRQPLQLLKQQSSMTVVRMMANPLQHVLEAADIEMFKGGGMVGDYIVDFHLGLCQLEALQTTDNAEPSWMFLTSSFFTVLTE